MGASTSNTAGKEKRENTLSEQEKSKLKDYFHECCSFTLKDLLSYTEGKCSEFFAKKLHSLMKVKSHGKSESVDEKGFCSTLCLLLNGDHDEQIETVFLLFSSGQDDVTSEIIYQVVEEAISIYSKVAGKNSTLPSCINSWNEDSIANWARLILRDLIHPGIHMKDLKTAENSSKTFKLSEFKIWLEKSPEFPVIVHAVISHLFPFKESPEDVVNELQNTGLFIPEIKVQGNLSNSLLDVPRILMLNSKLASSLRKEWTLLFTSASDGQSFSTLVQHIRNEGPSLVVVKDKDGHVFGGFASDSWDFNANFTGQDSCFLFNLHPFMGVYGTTGYNKHFMYLNLHQETLPNGLGMGGQLDYFGFWIDSNYGVGKCSLSCTTFDCPMLSAVENFEIETIEVWRVGPKPVISEEEEEAGISVLDKNPEAKAMLLLIDKGPHSEGLRNKDPTVQSPEEKELPPM